MPKVVIRSDKAPAPVAAYSQAIRAGDFLFLSGQIPLDPETHQLVSGGIESETRRVLDNLAAVLEAGGATFADVVKMTVYLADMQDFAAFNAVYVSYFPEQPPARATVAVLGLPRGVRVEIDAIAYLAR
ncbi:MAG TPA: RidA family protein [Polyangiaceae bacterium]|nr:RidA family protein [Polyangiaceae bacterium]